MASPAIQNPTTTTQPTTNAPDGLQQAANELAAARASSQVDPAAPAPAEGQQPAAAEPAAPLTYEQTDLGDGQFQIRLNTGEIYKGTPGELMTKLAQSSANTHNYARELKQKVQTYEAAAPKAPELAPVAQDTQTAPAAPGLDPAVTVLADMQAQYLGFENGAAMKDYFQKLQTSQSYLEGQNIANQFRAQNPDFPTSERNSEILGNFIESNGLQYNPQHMTIAHNFLKNQNAYDPVSLPPQQQQQFNRPAAPPVAPPSSSQPMSNGGVTLAAAESMSVEDLGAQLMRLRQGQGGNIH